MSITTNTAITQDDNDPNNAFSAEMARLILNHGVWVVYYEGYFRMMFNRGIVWGATHSD